MKTKTKGLIALIVVIVAAIYYYVTIPAINIHSTDTWGAVLFLIVIALIVKLFFLWIQKSCENSYQRFERE